MKLKVFLAMMLSVILAAGMLSACASSSGEGAAASEAATETAAPAGTTAAEPASSEGSVYFLNFKPEVAEKWEEIAQVYSGETGVTVEVMTAASNMYEQTLRSEIAKTKAPTLFQINGPVGYQNWSDYCLDLKDTEFYEYLSDKSLAVTSGDGVYGIPYAIEGYGIIYNKTIVADYCALDGAVIASADEIVNFDTLKAVAEDMQARKDELGIEGAFASTSFAAGEDWRWQTHLANVPLYYEFQDKGVDDAETVDGTYLENFKNIFDLYINNSITSPNLLSSKTVGDSMAEFALGQVAFAQNGDWAWGDIKDNEVGEDEIGYLPIYIGVDGEENQGLCVGTENFWSINSQASEADQQATLDFVKWLLTSDTGKDYLVNQMGFTAPFTTFGEEEAPSNPLSNSILEYSASGKTAVSWAFSAMPSQTYKNHVGQALLEYAQGTGTWDNVEIVFIDEWAAEKVNPTAEQ